MALSESRLRCHTADLERVGLIERRTAANGSRSLHAGTGLYFSGAIARLPELGRLNPKEIAALGGQAPLNRDSRTLPLEANERSGDDRGHLQMPCTWPWWLEASAIR